MGGPPAAVGDDVGIRSDVYVMVFRAMPATVPILLYVSLVLRTLANSV